MDSSHDFTSLSIRRGLHSPGSPGMGLQLPVSPNAGVCADPTLLWESTLDLAAGQSAEQTLLYLHSVPAEHMLTGLMCGCRVCFDYYIQFLSWEPIEYLSTHSWAET